MGEFEYGSDDMLQMDIELRYDYAQFNSIAAGGAKAPIQASSVKTTATGESISDGYEGLRNKTV